MKTELFNNQVERFKINNEFENKEFFKNTK